MAQDEDSICPICIVPQNKIPHGAFCKLGGIEVISLRDQFAMAALSWDRLEYLLPGGGERDAAEVAAAAYELADAMLEARKPK